MINTVISFFFSIDRYWRDCWHSLSEFSKVLFIWLIFIIENSEKNIHLNNFSWFTNYQILLFTKKNSIWTAVFSRLNQPTKQMSAILNDQSNCKISEIKIWRFYYYDSEHYFSSDFNFKYCQIYSSQHYSNGWYQLYLCQSLADVINITLWFHLREYDNT